MQPSFFFILYANWYKNHKLSAGTAIMSFYIDLRKISIDDFKTRLREEKLLPSQQILKEDIDKRFKIISNQKIDTMAGLQSILQTKKNVKKFSLKTSLPEDYLIEY